MYTNSDCSINSNINYYSNIWHSHTSINTNNPTDKKWSQTPDTEDESAQLDLWTSGPWTTTRGSEN